MTTKLSSFPQPDDFRSPLLKNQPDAIPSIDELELLQSELIAAKLAVRKRRDKAEEDLKILSESMRRMVEKDRGKGRVVDKVKRERGYTPIDGDDARSTSSLPGSSTKSRTNLASVASSSRGSVDPRKGSSYIDDKKKKKKRKREGGDSDVEPEHQRPRKMSPHISSTPHPHPPQKLPKPPLPLPPHASHASHPSHPKVHVPHPLPTPGPDFTLPPSLSLPLLPPRPPIPQPPHPYPPHPTLISTNFTSLKPPPQVLVTTFFSSVEPYVRPIKEEDVGFLECVCASASASAGEGVGQGGEGVGEVGQEEVDAFVLPPLGRHYTEVWEDLDTGLSSATLPTPSTSLSHTPTLSSAQAPTPLWDPSTLSDTDLSSELKAHGPLTERVVSALLPIPDLDWKGVKAAEDAMEGRPGGSGAAAARRERLNVSDLERRIVGVMRWHGLVDGVPDLSQRTDDPICTALRHAQHELRRVMLTNKLRRLRLASIARDRLAYQEYLDLRDAIDRNISTLYSKLQKRDKEGAMGGGAGAGRGRRRRKVLQGAAKASHVAALGGAGAGVNGGGMNGNGYGHGNGHGHQTSRSSSSAPMDVDGPGGFGSGSGLGSGKTSAAMVNHVVNSHLVSNHNHNANSHSNSNPHSHSHSHSTPNLPLNHNLSHTNSFSNSFSNANPHANSTPTPTPTPLLPPCPAALGLSPDENNRLNVNEQLRALVEMRRRWVDEVGGVFEGMERGAGGEGEGEGAGEGGDGLLDGVNAEGGVGVEGDGEGEGGDVEGEEQKGGLKPKPKSKKDDTTKTKTRTRTGTRTGTGRIYGLPRTSVFEGIEEEVEAELGQRGFGVGGGTGVGAGGGASASVGGISGGGGGGGGAVKVMGYNPANGIGIGGGGGGGGLKAGKGKEKEKERMRDAMDISSG